MKFLETLQQRTAADRAFLVEAPVIRQALAGDITRERYLLFLTQAWHHVRCTVPLMMAVGSRLPPRLAWLRKEIAHYIEEEEGHDDWILADIRAAGGDPDAAAASTPLPATDAMIAYAWDTAMRRNPAGFFGMVFVLEGTSIALALQAADRIQKTLQLPPKAMTYLRSHGQLDQEHIHHLADILERLDDPADRIAVEGCARTIFWLYGNVFRGIESASAAETLRRSA
jgi:pyrroloquinoline quinone (PQQ) biosynthesis protein C